MTALWNELNAAARILVGSGPVKQRLLEAWNGHLASLHDKEVPDALRARLATVRHAMFTSPPAGGVTAAANSVRKMSEKEAAEHAIRILEVYSVLCAIGEAEFAGGRRLRVVNSGADGYDAGDDELPAFLSRA